MNAARTYGVWRPPRHHQDFKIDVKDKDAEDLENALAQMMIELSGTINSDKLDKIALRHLLQSIEAIQANPIKVDFYIVGETFTLWDLLNRLSAGIRELDWALDNNAYTREMLSELEIDEIHSLFHKHFAVFWLRVVNAWVDSKSISEGVVPNEIRRTLWRIRKNVHTLTTDGASEESKIHLTTLALDANTLGVAIQWLRVGTALENSALAMNLINIATRSKTWAQLLLRELDANKIDDIVQEEASMIVQCIDNILTDPHS